MKRVIAILMMIFLVGCNKADSALDQAITLRNRLLNGNGCAFDAVITADYGEKLYTFSMNCKADATGNLTFSVTEPKSVSGIAGTISESGGKLTFDDQALAFEMLADGQVTPVSAPWLFLKTLRSGYLNAAGRDGEYIKLIIDDSYEENPIQLDIWMDANMVPIRSEILWQGRRVISLAVNNFQIL